MRRTTGVASRMAVVLATVVVATAGLTASVGAAPGGVPGPPGGGGSDPDPAIDIIGAWNENISDGICYSISVPAALETPTGTVAAAIDGAVRDWLVVNDVSNADALLEFKNSDEGQCATPEVQIVLRRGGGTIQGTTSFDGDGPYIAGASIVIRGKFTSQTNDAAAIAHITRHEFGHALGLGHWNVRDLLMSPYLNATTSIGTCEQEAVVLVAQAWFFSGGTQPVVPASDPYVCP